MANIPKDLRYTAEHEYVKQTAETGVVVVGITDYAQGELGDVVYVELPKAGAVFTRMQVFGTIEAVKAVSELFCPVAGTVVEADGGGLDDQAADAEPGRGRTADGCGSVRETHWTIGRLSVLGFRLPTTVHR